MITYTEDDIFAIQNPFLLCHIVNNIGAWGAGFVLQINTHWHMPQVCFKRRNFELGNVQAVPVTGGYVLNMCAQNGLRSAQNPHPIDYTALETCLKKAQDFATRQNLEVHMPMIGAGLAGGDWQVIEAIIQKTITQAFVHKLPSANKERKQ